MHKPTRRGPPRIPRHRASLFPRASQDRFWLIRVPLVLLLLYLSLMLAGCASGTPPTEGHLTVRPDAMVMRPCPPPPPALAKGATEGQMVLNHTQAMKAYWGCVDRNQDKIDWINKVVPKD